MSGHAVDFVLLEASHRIHVAKGLIKELRVVLGGVDPDCLPSDRLSHILSELDTLGRIVDDLPIEEPKIVQSRMGML